VLLYADHDEACLSSRGGSLGTVLRYSVYEVAHKFSQGAFPWATLIVNIMGSLVAGLLLGFFEKTAMAPHMRLFIFIGFLGAFTTFSTFSMDIFHLLRDAQYKVALSHMLLNNILCVVLVFAGFVASKSLISLAR